MNTARKVALMMGFLLAMFGFVRSQGLNIQDISASPSYTCSQQTVQLSVTATGGTGNYTYSWVGNPGTFTSNLQNPIAFPAVNTTYTVVVNDGNQAVQAQVSVAVVPNPTVDAGDDAIICENTPSVMLTGSAQNYSYLEWTTQGDGVFNNTGISSATFTPGPQDKENGSVTLTLHAFASPPCTGSISDQMTLDIASFPTADAGADQEICENENVSLSANVENYSSIAWSSNGDGYFTDFSSPQTTYFPAGDDFDNGNVQLTLIANSLSPCTGSISDNLNVSIVAQPVADAGADAEICANSNYQLSGIPENESAVFWTTSGDGNFQNPNQANATYIPGEQDSLTGEVTLTMTAIGEGACNNFQAEDEMILQIYQQPQVNAGEDSSFCENESYTLNPENQHVASVEWSTSGDGSFDDTTLAEATYEPGPQDKENGAVTLTLSGNPMAPCTGTTTDQVELTIDPLPVVDAGADAENCDNASFQVAGQVENAASYYWSTSGDGQFNDSTLLNAMYTPGPQDAQNGAVTLTLTAQASSSCETEITDAMTLSFIPGPSVNAGADAEICETDTHQVTGTVSETDIVVWSTSGDGGFDDDSSLTAEYTPGDADIANGQVYLYLTGTNTSCGSSQDSILLTIVHEPLVNAGPDTLFCADPNTEITIDLTAEAENFVAVEWATSGDGEFTDPSSLNTTYTLLGDDITNQGVTLSLTVYPNSPCSDTQSDAMEIDFNYSPVADAGSDEVVCEGDDIELNGSGSNYYTSVYWFRLPNSTGQGQFSNQNSLVSIYEPSDDDYENGGVSFRLQVQNLGCNPPAYDTVNFDIQRKPSVDAGEDFSICRGGTAQLDATVEFATGIQWNTLPGSNGSFSDASVADPIYTPGSNDISNGVAKLVVSGWAALPCDTPGRDTIEIAVNDLPTANLGQDIEACSGSTVDLVAEAENFSTITWSTSGDGSFSGDDLNTSYTIGEQDAIDGQVTITFTAQPDFPCNQTAEDQLVISIKDGAFISLDHVIAGNYNESYAFEPEVTSESTNLSYYWEPETLLLDPNVKDATTIPFPSDGDSTYLFTFSVTNEENGCVSSDTTRVYLDLGPVSLNVTADPAYVCEGGTSTTLYANAAGGTGFYTYYWQADNSTWTSDLATPVVSPTERTTYSVTVNDGNTSPSGTIIVDIKPTPSTPAISGEDRTSHYSSEVYTTTGSDLAYYEWWAKNGAVIEGQGTKAATIEWGAAGTGIIYLRMANEFGCFGDTSQMAVSIGTISVEELSGVNNLKIYPNPVKGNLFIDFDLKEEQRVGYQLMDSRGMVVQNKSKKLMEPGSHQVEIHLGTRSAGIYLLRLIVDDNAITKRIVVMQ